MELTFHAHASARARLRMCQQILCHLIFSGFGDEKSEGGAGKGTEGQGGR